jgi:DNA-binding MarR family transcriptional regulator
MNSSLSEKLFQQIHYFTNLIHREHHFPHSNPAESGMGRGQGLVLRVLLEKDGLTQKELTDQLRIRPSSLGELVDKLEQNGYVERRVNENDKRIINVYLTEKGRIFANDMISARQGTVDALFSGLSESEKAQLSDLLGKLITSMEEKHSENADDFDERGMHFRPGHMGMEEHADFPGRPFGFPDHDHHQSPFDDRRNDGHGDFWGRGRNDLE